MWGGFDLEPLRLHLLFAVAQEGSPQTIASTGLVEKGKDDATLDRYAPRLRWRR